MYEQRSAEDRTGQSELSSVTRSSPRARAQLALLWTVSVIGAALLGIMPALAVAHHWNSTNVTNITPVPNATNFPPTAPPVADREPIGQNPECWIEDFGWPHDCLSKGAPKP